ncbi:hypothetical protein [Bdellovibrio sp.]|uniref:hypothetical protein n=1 Tax=Bdellovibrio sp. TaxID=28201 RepID=UPI0039E67403
MKKNIAASLLMSSVLGASLSASAGTGQIGSGAVEVKSCTIQLADYAYQLPPAPILKLLTEKGYYPIRKSNLESLVLDLESAGEIFTGYKYSKLAEQFLKTYAPVYSLNLYGEERIGDFNSTVKYASVKQSNSDAIAGKDRFYDEYLTLSPESFLNMIRQLPNCKNNILVPAVASERGGSQGNGVDWSNLP